MSLLPFIVMNGVVLAIIGYVFFGALAEQRERYARVRSPRHTDRRDR